LDPQLSRKLVRYGVASWAIVFLVFVAILAMLMWNYLHDAARLMGQ
jgi:hypothetical protein